MCLLDSVCVSFSPPERCEEVLASPLPYSAFTSSSVLAADFGAGYAKLNRRLGERGLHVWDCTLHIIIGINNVLSHDYLQNVMITAHNIQQTTEIFRVVILRPKAVMCAVFS